MHRVADLWVCVGGSVAPNGVQRRCRKCLGCLKRREWQWSQRGQKEAQASRETRFVTLTFKGDHPPEYEAVSLFLRGTNNRGGVLGLCPDARYMATEERGEKGGRLHWHLLLHTNSRAVTKRALEALWPHGFTRIELARGDGSKLSRYIAKYNAKAGHIRASQGYGTCLCTPGREFDRENPESWRALRVHQIAAIKHLAARKVAGLPPREYLAALRKSPDDPLDPPDRDTGAERAQLESFMESPLYRRPKGVKRTQGEGAVERQ